jgi:phospholipase D1/2
LQFKEHLGLLKHDDGKIDVTDPISDAFYKNIWLKVSQENTQIYEEVFHAIPSNNVRNFMSMKKYTADETALSKSDPEAAEQKLKKIHGFLVDLPLDFLCEEVRKI